MEGTGIAVLFAGLGAVAKLAGDHFEEGEEDESLNLYDEVLIESYFYSST